MPKSPYYGSVYFQSPYFGGPGGSPAVPEFEDYAITLRKGLAELLQDGKDTDRFIFNDFDLIESWLPYKQLENLKKDSPNGRLYLVAYPADEQNTSRTNMVQQEVPILIGYQKAGVKHQDIEAIDRLKSFVAQVDYVCRRYDPDHYSYSRTEALKDDEGLPFGYENITQGIFETYFIIYYNLVAY